MTRRTQKVLLVLAAVMLSGLVLAVLFGAVVNGWRAAVRAGNEAATVQNLKTIAAVESQYFLEHKRNYGTLEELLREQMVNSKFAGNPVTSDGYVFSLTLTPERAAYKIAADPASEAGKHFYLDSTSGQIHFHPDHPAGPNDPVLAK